MIAIVLDTNVLVSGLLKPFSSSADILRLIINNKIKLYIDTRIMIEYKLVLKRKKFQFDSEKVDILLGYFESIGVSVIASPLPYRLPDKGDEPFLEVAIAGNVKYLITGNTKHFPTKKRDKVTVLNPSEFIEEYRIIGFKNS